MTLPQMAMTGAACCYAVGCVGYYLEGKPWMSTTLLLYAMTAVTLYMGGDK